jgi:hypothetical protein
MTPTYRPGDYDHEFCLKPPLLLWLAVLYLSRGFTLPVLVGMAHMAGVDPDVLSRLREFWNPGSLIPSSIAAPVLYSFFRRVPTAAAGVRWVWANGRTFLAVAAAIDMVVPFVVASWNRTLGEMPPGSWAASAIDVYFLAYVLGPRRVLDTFDSFPPSPPPKESP